VLESQTLILWSTDSLDSGSIQTDTGSLDSDRYSLTLKPLDITPKTGEDGAHDKPKGDIGIQIPGVGSFPFPNTGALRARPDRHPLEKLTRNDTNFIRAKTMSMRLRALMSQENPGLIHSDSADRIVGENGGKATGLD
jgi:hypothetical protein